MCTGGAEEVCACEGGGGRWCEVVGNCMRSALTRDMLEKSGAEGEAEAIC